MEEFATPLLVIGWYIWITLGLSSLRCKLRLVLKLSNFSRPKSDFFLTSHCSSQIQCGGPAENHISRKNWCPLSLYFSCLCLFDSLSLSLYLFLAVWLSLTWGSVALCYVKKMYWCFSLTLSLSVCLSLWHPGFLDPPSLLCVPQALLILLHKNSLHAICLYLSVCPFASLFFLSFFLHAIFVQTLFSQTKDRLAQRDQKSREVSLTSCPHHSLLPQVPVIVQITAPHRGWFEFRLCKNDDVTKPATQACLDEHVLGVLNETGSRYHVHFDYPLDYAILVQLPAGLTCTQCVFQWLYNAGWFQHNSGLGSTPLVFRGETRFWKPWMNKNEVSNIWTTERWHNWKSQWNFNSFKILCFSPPL